HNDKPTYFRFLTLLAFHVFIREKVDVAVFEVGIGGEYDSTNVVEQPIVTGISALGLDHVSVLGATVDKIAWHKAGIFKVSSRLGGYLEFVYRFECDCPLLLVRTNRTSVLPLQCNSHPKRWK